VKLKIHYKSVFMKLVAKLLSLLLAVAMVAPLPITGVETSIWQVSDFKEFLKGRLTGVSISKDGRLGLAPQAKMVFNPDEALALSLVADRQHNLYVGTGHQGRVFRVTAAGKSSLFFKAQEPDVFALAAGPDGDLYVGSSPEGKIYRVSPDGKSSVFYDPNTKYIWAMLFDSEGRLYVATGDQGQILQVDRSGKGKVFFDSNQTHIMCLAFDRSNNLLAGSVPDGLVYRIAPDGKAFVIYQADLPEIHDLVVDAQGDIYASALGSPSQRGVPMMLMPQTPAIALPTEVVTVTADTQNGLPEDNNPPAQKPKKPELPTEKKRGAPSFIRPGAGVSTASGLAMLQGRGELIRISPTSSVETMWNSNTESAYGLAVLGKKIVFSTDSDGQIFELDPTQFGENLTLLTETHESVATRLMLEGNNLYIATSNVAKLFRMGDTSGREGTYESRVNDTNFISRWGVISWRSDTPAGSSIEFYTRTGNFKRPDQTWSDWAGPYRNQDGSQISSPAARYIQWKAVFRGSSSARPSLDEVSVAFLNQNLPPEIESFNVSNAGERTSTGSSVSSASVSAVSVSVTSTPQITYTDPSQVAQANTKNPVTLTWKASDPNGDKLEYSLYLKSSDEATWHLLKDKIKTTSYTLDHSTLADGQYTAMLVASDALSNPPATARKDQMLSTPFWIDNTPPAVTVEHSEVRGNRAVVQFRVEDATSPLHNAQSSAGGDSWQEINSDDGIIDSQTETFTVKTGDLSTGEHVITLRAYDMAGNVGVGKVVVEIKGKQ
jgi:sugar lactone lactonase YvrE